MIAPSVLLAVETQLIEPRRIVVVVGPTEFIISNFLTSLKQELYMELQREIIQANTYTIWFKNKSQLWSGVDEKIGRLLKFTKVDLLVADDRVGYGLMLRVLKPCLKPEIGKLLLVRM